MQGIRKILLFVFVISAVFVLKVSAQDISSDIEYSVHIKKDNSADVVLTQNVFNNSSDQLITDFSVNIPFAGINVLEVLFNNSPITYSAKEENNVFSLSMNLGSNVIQPGNGAVFKIRFINRRIFKEINHIQFLEIHKAQSSHKVNSSKFIIDYSASDLGSPSFISSGNLNENKRIEINDGEALVLWSKKGNYNLSFLQNVDSRGSEDLLFNFLNQDFFSKVIYSDLKNFKSGLRDSKNNYYGIAELPEGKSTVGYIATIQPTEKFPFKLSGDELINLVSLQQVSSPQYDTQISFEKNILNALSQFKDVLLNRNNKFASVHDYFGKKQSNLDYCIYLSSLGEEWKFDVETYAGIMTFDYGVLNSNQNIWCKIAYQDKEYSLDYFHQSKLGYDFLVEGDFADRLPLIRLNSNSIDSFFLKYFNNLDIKITTNLNEVTPENAELESEIQPRNENNYSGEPVTFNLYITNPLNVFVDISSIKINEIDIDLKLDNKFIFALLPLTKTTIPLSVVLEKDFFANVQKSYYAEIELSNGQILSEPGTINLEIDYVNFILNLTLVSLIVILLIYIIRRYIDSKKEKPSYIKK